MKKIQRTAQVHSRIVALAAVDANVFQGGVQGLKPYTPFWRSIGEGLMVALTMT